MKRMRSSRGFTLIEVIIVISIMSILVALVAPSFKKTIVMQRLRGVNAELVQDLQYMRAEAVNRSRMTRIHFRTDSEVTCYTIDAVPTLPLNTACDCRLGAGQACTASPTSTELKTVSIPKSMGVEIASERARFSYDFVTSGLFTAPIDTGPLPLVSVNVETRIDGDRLLRVRIGQSGRPSVCSTNPNLMQVAAC